MSEHRVKREEKMIQKSYSYFALKSPDEIYYQMASIFKACKRTGKSGERGIHPHWSNLSSAGVARLTVKA